jgi:hypothetical protein
MDLDASEVRKHLALCDPARIHNTFIPQFFDPLTVYGSRTGYVAGGLGAALLVLSLLMAAYFWKRCGEVEGKHRLDATATYLAASPGI